MAVVVHYAGNADRAREVVEAIVAAGGRADRGRRPTSPTSTRWPRLFDAVEAAFGGVDVVVHTAGIMLLAPLAELDLDDFDRMHRTNVRGTFVVDQQAARRLRAGGAIDQLLDLRHPRSPSRPTARYAATKGAVEAMTLILAKELRGRDVTVNAVAPGPTATPLFLDGKDRRRRRPAGRGRPAGAPRAPRGHRRARSRSWPARPAGSTARSSSPTAGSPEPDERIIMSASSPAPPAASAP